MRAHRLIKGDGERGRSTNSYDRPKRRQQCLTLTKALELAGPRDAQSVMASLVSSDTTHGEPSFVPRNASIASGAAGKVIANGRGGSKSLSTSRKRTARRCYDHQDLRAICLLSRPAVAWINAMETGLVAIVPVACPGVDARMPGRSGWILGNFHISNAAFVRSPIGRPREENS
jgi:hypothetical protein